MKLVRLEGSVKVITCHLEPSAGAVSQNSVKVEARPYAEWRTRPLTQMVNAYGSRVLNVRLLAPDVPVENEYVVSLVSTGMQHVDSRSRSGRRGEDRSYRITPYLHIRHRIAEVYVAGRECVRSVERVLRVSLVQGDVRHEAHPEPQRLSPVVERFLRRVFGCRR